MSSLADDRDEDVDLQRKTEEEEIVAQVSYLISNMDLNQQTKLMSQIISGTSN